MELQSLGYVGINAPGLDDWEAFGSRLLGMQVVERTRSGLRLRMDDRRQRVIVHGDGGGKGIAYFGWEVADAAALDRLAQRLEAAEVRVERLPRTLADHRRVRDAIVFADPLGKRLEAFHGAELSDDPFKPGRAISGFRTGALGLGHVVMNVKRIDELMPFYTDVLGFRLTDYLVSPFKAYFFHLNPRHHSFAMVESATDSVHHMMVEMFMLDDVGQAYDLALLEEDRIAVTFGRHANDLVTSFYSHSPSGFMVECGWGGRSIDVDNWTPHPRTEGPSLWGHDRGWLPPEKRQAARDLRMRVAADGARFPVQVLKGNHQLMPGTCPWWDAARRAG